MIVTYDAKKWSSDLSLIYYYLFIFFFYLVRLLREDWRVIIDIQHMDGKFGFSLMDSVWCFHSQCIDTLIFIVQAFSCGNYPRVLVNCKTFAGPILIFESVCRWRTKVYIICNHLGDNVANRKICGDGKERICSVCCTLTFWTHTKTLPNK